MGGLRLTAVTPRTRTAAIVVALAAAAAVAVVGAEVIRSAAEPGATTSTAPEPRAGVPPLAFDLGVRDDAEARGLRRAERLYADGRRDDAAAIFARHASVEARVGAALARWPAGSVAALRDLARAHPRDDFVRLHTGLALFWVGDVEAARTEWRAAVAPSVDSASALRAEDLLFPNFPRGRPTFVPSFDSSVASGSPAQQLNALRSGAVRGGAREKLAYGVALQRLGRPLEARAQYDAAVRAGSGAIEAKVAAAVVRFAKASPRAAFARLGPLSSRSPRSQSVRFHLGLLLLWLGEVDDARVQLERTQALDGSSRLGAEANAYLVRLEAVRSDE